jgi:hypothetical protein
MVECPLCGELFKVVDDLVNHAFGRHGEIDRHGRIYGRVFVCCCGDTFGTNVQNSPDF